MREVLLRDNPEHVNDCPSPDSIDNSKAAQVALVTDNCSTARKVKRGMNTRLGGECFEIDCHNHLRNTYLCNSVEKALSKFLTVELKESLDKIDSRLRVTTLWLAFARAYDKEFSLAANYPKGHGALFLAFVRKYYPGILLFHVESTHGARQDIMYSSALAIYINRWLNVEFLDKCLSVTGKKNNILQRNLFVLLTSDEIVAQSRLLSIVYVSCMLPLRWLAGKTHELAKYKWGAYSMGLVLDTFRTKLRALKAVLKLFLNETFMMSLFEDIMNKLPLFRDYWDHLLKKKTMNVVSRKSGARLMGLAGAVKEMFHPKVPTNIACTVRLLQLVIIFTETVLQEMENKQKATYWNLSISNSDICYESVKNFEDKLLLNIKAVNDDSESALGGTTANIQRGNRIDATSAAGCSDSKRNK